MSKQEVIICQSLQEDLERALDAHAYDKLFILTDEHTRRLCLPLVGIRNVSDRRFPSASVQEIYIKTLTHWPTYGQP
mgnify:FL=1